MTEMIREIRSTRRPAVLAWVPVTGADGRVRMEMRWQVGGTSAGAQLDIPSPTGAGRAGVREGGRKIA